MIDHPRTSSKSKIALAPLLCTLAACSQFAPVYQSITTTPQPDGSITAQSPGGSITLLSQSPGFDATRQRYNLDAPKGQTVSFQLNMQATSGDVKNLDIRIQSPFDPQLFANDQPPIRIHRIHPIETQRWPGWHVRYRPDTERTKSVPDALVPINAPRGGLPADVTPNQPMNILIEMLVPLGASPGTHTTAVDVVSAEGLLFRLPVCIDVQPFMLTPPANPLLFANISVNDIRAPQIAQTLDRHSLTPLLVDGGPSVKLDTSGKLVIDWQEYDASVRKIIRECKHTRPWIEIPLNPQLYAAACAGNPDRLTQYLRKTSHHFAQRGWLDRAIVQPPDVPDITESDLANLRTLCSAARSADRRLRILTTATANDFANVTWAAFQFSELVGAIDIWAPPARFAEPNVVPHGCKTWMRTDVPPYSGTTALTGQPIFARILPWQAERYNVRAVLLGDAKRILHDGRRWDIDAWLPSLRMNHLREGIRDIATLRRLQSLTQSDAADNIVRTVVPIALHQAHRFYNGDTWPITWADDPKTVERARDAMADAIEARLNRSAEETPAFDANAILRRITTQSQPMRILPEGTRVQASISSAVYHIECHLTVENRSPNPLTAQLKLDDPPLGWSTDDKPVSVNLPPWGRKRCVITADTATLAWSDAGFIDLTFSLEYNATTHIQTTRLAIVGANPKGTPIQIDGDLSDWGFVSSNLGTDFQPIDRTTSRTNGDMGPNRFIVAHDADTLYIAVIASPPAASVASISANHLRTEDSLPLDHDLIEVLLDPTNAGTHDPGDIFRLAFIPGGALFEKDLPVSEGDTARRWSADIRYAARITDSAWTIEVAVPIESLSASSIRPAVWGLNVTHFNAQDQRYTSWSAARHNLYDTMTFGNLIITTPPN